MSKTISPAAGMIYGLQRVCTAWDLCRSTYYARREAGRQEKEKRGPKTVESDEELVCLIREEIESSPFIGEGYKKISARLNRRKVRAGKNRVLRLMRENGLLSPHRGVKGKKNEHKGKIITDKPNVMWCSDGTKLFTVRDGWVWIFLVEEHWNGECLGWHVCKMGDRFAALEPVTQAVKRIFKKTGKGVAKGVKLRIDNGTQYRSDYFLKQIGYMGIESSFGLVRQPQTNGVIERFNRTLKEQILKGSHFTDIEEVRRAVRGFVKQYNEKWLLAKLGYQSPLEAREALMKKRGEGL